MLTCLILKLVLSLVPIEIKNFFHSPSEQLIWKKKEETKINFGFRLNEAIIYSEFKSIDFNFLKKRVASKNFS